MQVTPSFWRMYLSPSQCRGVLGLGASVPSRNWKFPFLASSSTSRSPSSQASDSAFTCCLEPTEDGTHLAAPIHHSRSRRAPGPKPTPSRVPSAHDSAVHLVVHRHDDAAPLPLRPTARHLHRPRPHATLPRRLALPRASLDHPQRPAGASPGPRRRRHHRRHLQLRLVRGARRVAPRRQGPVPRRLLAQQGLRARAAEEGGGADGGRPRRRRRAHGTARAAGEPGRRQAGRLGAAARRDLAAAQRLRPARQRLGQGGDVGRRPVRIGRGRAAARLGDPRRAAVAGPHQGRARGAADGAPRARQEAGQGDGARPAGRPLQDHAGVGHAPEHRGWRVQGPGVAVARRQVRGGPAHARLY